MARDVPSERPMTAAEADDLADIRYATPLGREELPTFGDTVLDERDRLDWQRRRQEYRNRPEGEGTWSGPIALRLGDLLAHHEQSETVVDPASQRWVNVYGGVAGSPNVEGPARGLRIPLEPGVSYPTSQAGDRAAEIRSRMYPALLERGNEQMRLKDLLRP